jgi:hypothetical protein
VVLCTLPGAWMCTTERHVRSAWLSAGWGQSAGVESAQPQGPPGHTHRCAPSHKGPAVGPWCGMQHQWRMPQPLLIGSGSRCAEAQGAPACQ